MTSAMSSGSPVLTKKASAHFSILDQSTDLRSKMGPPSGRSASDSPNPLQTSKLGNLQPQGDDKRAKASPNGQKNDSPSPIDNILARLRAKDVSSTGVRAISNPTSDQVLAQLDDQRGTLKKQRSDLGQPYLPEKPIKQEPKTSSASDFIPAVQSLAIGSGDASNDREAARADAAEILRVKQELAAAKSVIKNQEMELAETRTFKHTMDQAMGPSSEADFVNNRDLSDAAIGHMQSAFNAAARPFTTRTDNWTRAEDARSDHSDTLSAGGYNRAREGLNSGGQIGYTGGFPNSQVPFNDPRFGHPLNGSWNPAYGGQGILGSLPNSVPMNPNQRLFSGPAMPTMSVEGRFANDGNQFGQTNGYRRSTSQYSRPGSSFSNRSTTFGNMAGNMAGMLPNGPPQMGHLGYPGAMGYQPRPIGTPLSPTASEFSAGSLGAAPWTPMAAASGQTYVTPLEPLNYRRLLDKSVTCDWKYIVDKIVCSNDQQASIFLQQKLKVGTAEQKFDIVDAIVNQAYPLMINRFGNFLVQRCFEHGTPDQVVAIANAIHGNVLSLSMDAFGCHVIQKAFDSVPENHKADMVRELLRRIPDTVIHRYACHVWQKLFELRWSGEPPQIMQKVNEALRGMWHEVALGETGSLVVQNIFENCVEEEKRPAIEEVVHSIDLIAHGQFGNWCIQHLCEHGSPADKRRVIDHILNNGYNYSIDQFASKVVEKCLKIGGSEFLDRYLGVITAAHPDRPRIPLIDIAGDQYGNYLIQWILMNTQYHQREQVAIHIRKHMVSLRGSKFGSRVAMLCCNPASVTRPGPGVIVNPFGAPGQPRGWGRFR